MALLDYSTLSPALSQLFSDKLRRQANRISVLANLIPKKMGAGKNVAWDAEFSGASAAAYADGADAATFDTDVSVPATINWARYRSNFSVSGMAISAAQTSNSPEELLNVILSKADGCAEKLLSVMNAGLYAGAGGDAFVGLATAVDDTAAYAGINRAVTYTEWQSSVLSNGAVVRDLTKELMDAAERSVYGKCSISPNFIVTTPIIASKFESLFDTNVRREALADLSPLAGVGEDGAIPGALQRNLMGFYKGIPVFRDKDCTAGQLFMLNSEAMSLDLLPQPGVNTSAMAADRQLSSDGERVSGIPARVEALGKLGDSERFTLKVYAQLKVARPNTCAVIKDLPTS